MTRDELRDLLGDELLSWAANVPELEAPPAVAGELTPYAQEALKAIVPHVGANRVSPYSILLGAHINDARERSGWVRPVVEVDPPTIDSVLQSLAIDAYPLVLLHRHLAKSTPFFVSFLPIVMQDPRDRELRELVSRDRELSELLTSSMSGKPGTGPYLSSNTGRSGPVQLQLLGMSILTCAASQMQMRGKSSLDAYLQTVASVLAVWRGLADSREADVDAFIGFRGVGLPAAAANDLGWGTLSAIDDNVIRVIPLDARPSKVLAADKTHFYDGVVLRTTFRLKVAIVNGLDDLDAQGNADSGEQELRRRANDLALSMLLAAGDLVAPAPVWQAVFDPTGGMPRLSWMHRRGSPQQSRLLSSDEVRGVRKWFGLIEPAQDSPIDVAKRRVLRSASERMDPEDGLVDAAIALECLFGDTNGELTLRISSAVAWLLGADVEERRSIQRRVKKLYRIRSHIVHGQNPKGRETVVAARDEALDFAVRCLRELYGKRSHLILDKERATTLLIGGETRRRSV